MAMLRAHTYSTLPTERKAHRICIYTSARIYMHECGVGLVLTCTMVRCLFGVCGFMKIHIFTTSSLTSTFHITLVIHIRKHTPTNRRCEVQCCVVGVVTGCCARIPYSCLI